MNASPFFYLLSNKKMYEYPSSFPSVHFLIYDDINFPKIYFERSRRFRNLELVKITKVTPKRDKKKQIITTTIEHNDRRGESG